MKFVLGFILLAMVSCQKGEVIKRVGPCGPETIFVKNNTKDQIYVFTVEQTFSNGTVEHSFVKVLPGADKPLNCKGGTFEVVGAMPYKDK